MIVINQGTKFDLFLSCHFISLLHSVITITNVQIIKVSQTINNSPLLPYLVGTNHLLTMITYLYYDKGKRKSKQVDV